MSEKLKIGIVGHGFVGKATDEGFDINVKKFIVDPLLNTNIDQLKEFNPKVVFICVPTPMSDDGNQDSSILEQVVQELSIKCPNVIMVIKSTVLPSVLMVLKKISSNIIYNPEFLREKHAAHDFVNSKLIIFGGDREKAKKIAKIYELHSKCICKDYIYLDLYSASLIKYSINTFLASKVVYFNELNSVFEKLNVQNEWKEIVNTIGLDERIGNSHMDVPGHDGKKGFGGACFPKDSLALFKYAKDLGVDLTILRQAILTNNSIREQYDDLDLREKEQNVSFDHKNL